MSACVILANKVKITEVNIVDKWLTLFSLQADIFSNNSTHLRY